MDLKVVILLVTSISLTTPSEIFSSTAELRLVAAQEQTLADTIQGFVQEEENSENIKRNLSMVMETPPIAPDDLDHPITVYKMIKKWCSVANILETSLTAETFDDLQNTCIKRGIPLMNNTDMMGALAALLRLQKTYALPTHELYNGYVNGVRAESLDHEDAFFLGQEAFLAEDYKIAVEWLEIASKSEPQTAAPNSVANANFELARAHYYIGDYDKAASSMRHASSLAPHNETIRLHVDKYDNVGTIEILMNSLYSLYSKLKTYIYEVFGAPTREDLLKYEKLCRGESTFNLDSKITTSGGPQMFCRYRKTYVPYYQIKEEVLSTDPWIAQLYDVIHEDEMDMIKSVAMQYLERALITGNGPEGTPSELRIGKLAWLDDDDGIPLIPKLSLRVSLITGLDTTSTENTRSAEAFQVVNYGIGGWYAAHNDFIKDEKVQLQDEFYEFGQRIATFMYYLSNVKFGGDTVFPRVNVRVPAIKGSAAYWFNIKRNGELDDRTLHAGCPVLLGEKWVANKWIRERGQEFRRPCGMTVDAEETGY